MSIGSISSHGAPYPPQQLQKQQGGSTPPPKAAGDTVQISKAALDHLKSGDTDGDGDNH